MGSEQNNETKKKKQVNILLLNIIRDLADENCDPIAIRLHLKVQHLNFTFIFYIVKVKIDPRNQLVIVSVPVHTIIRN